MCGTRSHSRTAPATDRPLLLIAAHGERGGAGENARLAEVADTASEQLSDWDVVHGVLSGDPSIEEALNDAKGRDIAIWPFFMCDGYFMNAALRPRLDALDVDYTMLPEYGASAELAVTALDMIRATGRLGHDILVIGHGSSKGSQSRQATERVAGALQAACGACVSCAFLDEEPFAEDIIPSLARGSLVVCLFAGQGLHGADDIPDMISASGRDDLCLIDPASDIAAVARVAVSAARNSTRSHAGENRSVLGRGEDLTVCCVGDQNRS